MRVGDIVIFGRPGGEQTMGEVKKVNRKTYLVQTMEGRGNGRGQAAGARWRVAHALCRLASPEEAGSARRAPQRAQGAYRTPSRTPVHLLIPQQPQRQDSLEDQLRDLKIAANRLGMYDAADHIDRILGR